MNKKILRVGIILILASVVLALILSGTPRRSKAASVTLTDGQYVRDGWIYGYPGKTGADDTDPVARFQKIQDITNYDVNINANATVRMDTSLGSNNYFNSLNLEENATLTHSALQHIVEMGDIYSTRWTGWILVPEDGDYYFYIDEPPYDSISWGVQLYIDFNSGEGSDANLTYISFNDVPAETSPWYFGMANGLTAGLHRIVINFYRKPTEPNSNQLSVVWQKWSGDHDDRVPIPTVNLYSEYDNNVVLTDPQGNGLVGDYFDSGTENTSMRIKNYRYTRIDPDMYNLPIGDPFLSEECGFTCVAWINTPSIANLVNRSDPLDPQNQYPGGFSRLIIRVNSNIKLETNAKISADGAGFPDSTLDGGSGAFIYNAGPGRGEKDKGGGSYCGRGKFQSGPIYGDGQANYPNNAVPTPLGSGGVRTAGGGFVSLNAQELVMEDNSRISANGLDFSSNGSGSGGTVFLYVTTTISQASNTSFSVDGGKNTNYSPPQYTGGAGRIAIYYPPGGSNPLNVSAEGFENCAVVFSEIGMSDLSILSITKNTSPATVKPNETVDIILTVYNPSDSAQTVNIKDDKFYNWNTYPLPGSNLWQELNVRLENGAAMNVGDIVMNSDNIEFKNVIIPPSLNGLPGRIKYTITVPENP